MVAGACTVYLKISYCSLRVDGSEPGEDEPLPDKREEAPYGKLPVLKCQLGHGLKYDRLADFGRGICKTKIGESSQSIS